MGSVISYYLKRANGGGREGGGKGEGEGKRGRGRGGEGRWKGGGGGGGGGEDFDIWVCDGKIYLLHSQGSAIFL